MIARIYRFLHPDHPGGMTGPAYAVATALLLLALGAQQLSGLRLGGFINSDNTPRPAYVPPSGPTYPAPPVAVKRHIAHAATAVPEIYGLKTADTGVDISTAINQTARTYGFGAVGYAALIGTESGFHQYAPHYPIAGAGACDYSGGLTQITVCTAAGLGIGNGSESQANINYVFWYEQADAARDIAFSAILVSQFKREVCWDWYELYASWNLGPGYGCYASVYEYPSNPITQQAVANFNSWLRWLYAYHVRWVSPMPPRRSPWPGRLWCSYARAHGRRCAPVHVGGHVRWEFSILRRHRHLGSYVSSTWNPRGRYSRYQFARGVAYAWPGWHAVKVVLR